jgi:hypothetical protein
VLPTCPMCRAPWKNEPLLKHLSFDEKLDAEAVQVYLDWVYSSMVRVPITYLRNTDTFNVMLLKCWAVASVVQDTSFRDIVIQTFFMEAGAGFWSSSVHWAFVEGNANNEIKDFVMDVFMAFIKPGWFVREGKKWPGVFVRSLADKMLKGTKREAYEEVKEAWLKKLEVEDGKDEGDEEQSVVEGTEAAE